MKIFLSAVFLTYALASGPAGIAADSNEAKGGAGRLTLYVSPIGNDSFPGLHPDPGAKQVGPMATIQAALRRAREIRATKSEIREVQILMRGGNYFLKEPISITSADSSDQNSLLVAAFKNERPRLSGGRALHGWKTVGTVWEMEIPNARTREGNFNQLFINGERRVRARTPNRGFFRISGGSPQDRPAKIHFPRESVKPAWASNGVELVAFLAWSDLRMPIAAVDAVNHVATLAGDARPSNREDYARFYVENAAEALDEPGEWYLDRNRGVLRYWPLPGETIEHVETIVPELNELLVVQGTTEKPVSHFHIEKVALADTDWMLPESGWADTQAAIGSRGSIRFEQARDSSVNDCELTHLGGYGIEIGRGCRGIRISNNRIHDLASGGIRIGETSIRPDPGEQTSNIDVTNNEISKLGRVFHAGIGVLILQSGRNRVSHNHIHDLYYTAVSVGWTWGYTDSPCRENLIEFNHLHDIGQEMLSDMGAVYTLGPQPGTVVRNNLIHDVRSFTYGGWGLYTDEGSTGILLENNVVFRTKSAGFHQHYGRENIIRNNVFAFGDEHQLMRTRPEAHLSFTFERNIVVFDSGDLLGSDWSGENVRLDRNLYFDRRLGSDQARMKFAGNSLEEWRRRGHDIHSVLADPRFVSLETFNLTLKKDSPAETIGFQPIDLSEVGTVTRKNQ
jgi:hypothetical protein